MGKREQEKEILDKKIGPYHKRPRPTILKWIKNAHSDNFAVNMEPLTITKD